MFGMSIASLLIWIVIIAACVALLYIALRQFGITIPPWIVQVFWIIIVALVVVWAIRFLVSAV